MGKRCRTQKNDRGTAAGRRTADRYQGQYHLLYGSISGARGQTDRFCRTDHSHPHGQIAPTLLDLGEKAMIGKGKRSKEVIDAIVRNHAVYFAAVGGAGALLSKCITKSEIVCYEDLGAEAIRKIEIRDFPVIVVIDSQGDNLYETAVKEFAG